MAKLLQVKGKKKIKKTVDIKTVNWGVGCKDSTCFSACKLNNNRYIVISPLKIMGIPECNSLEYITEKMLKLDFTSFFSTLAEKFNGTVVTNSKFKYLVYLTDKDARGCKNYLNKLLREI